MVPNDDTYITFYIDNKDEKLKKKAINMLNQNGLQYSVQHNVEPNDTLGNISGANNTLEYLPQDDEPVGHCETLQHQVLNVNVGEQRAPVVQKPPKSISTAVENDGESTGAPPPGHVYVADNLETASGFSEDDGEIVE
ncbi:hypothetical protein Q1695_012497 [Nippostrongylus brasiliensis]|nr:hypothetical protein Q1695_012497 [Nippostrongylus brasiliensis]